ncbi:MAG TPA: chromate efflux transporter [Chloroflexota bacterium]|nr:chromate efflux transporter [Chloroflexota bacterium]
MLGVAARLGCTSFGGPVAHLGYFRQEYVVRRRWLGERSYADLVALCQFLPGPASSQVGIAVGAGRAGIPGAVTAWLGFTLPSALALILFAYTIRAAGAGPAGPAWLSGALHGLEVVAVAVVALAVWGMARTLCPDRPRGTLAVLSACLLLLWPPGAGAVLAQLLVLALAALAGWRFLSGPLAGSGVVAGPGPAPAPALPLRRRLGLLSLVILAALLVALPLLRRGTGSMAVAVFDAMFRTGALVFGGGHVVLPLLQAEVVPPGWVTEEQFVAGYGAAQAVPGPLFSFAAYLGAVLAPPDSGPLGPLLWGLLALVAIFLPSFLLLAGALPFWDALRRWTHFQGALRGINAAVVGLLLAALYDPVWTSAIEGPRDVAFALAAFALLALWLVPPWVVVALGAAIGAAGAILVAP